MGQRIGRIELDDLAERRDGLRVLARTLQAGRHFVERRERVRGETELLVQLRELGRDVPVLLLELRRVLGDQLTNLLVDCNRFEREPLLRVELPDLLVGRDRVGVGLHLRLDVADLEQDPGIVRILLDDLLVLDDRLVVFLLLDKLLGGFEHLFAVDRHGLLYALA